MTTLLAIDQGTTSSRAILFDRHGQRLAVARRELPQHFPRAGWVEHDATRIWEDTVACVREVLQEAGMSAREVAAAGVTNQRETTVIWDRATGDPIHRAIVWQDRRTSDFCRLHQDRSEWLAARTGLRLDPYFSASKIAWLLDNVDGARRRAERGELAFGTIDSWLLWKLTGGKAHVTDATNASRTALFNLTTQDWDEELLAFFGVPRPLLPRVLDSAADFGRTDASLFGAPIAIGGVAGDQQAATIGQACFTPGMAKSTCGTGCFIVLNTGTELKLSRNHLLSTVAYRLEGRPTFAMEGSIFIAGAAVQWLRDSLHLIATAGETEQLAQSIPSTQSVYLVPAFTGLGAPHWDPEARGALLGLTRDTGIAQIARATLEAVAYQTRDLMHAMAEDALVPTELRVDGGMVVNNWLVQNLADMLQLPVVRPHTVETTSLGAALLAGLTAGVYDSLQGISRLWQAERRFTPRMLRSEADQLYSGWRDAVRRVRSESASR